MITINLREFYPWYTQDELIEVSDEVAEEMKASRRYDKIHKQRTRRNKSYYSLDVHDGIETSAIIYSTDDPTEVLERRERLCQLCCALNSLPEIQGRRIDAHFILGMSKKEIAKAEGVSERVVGIAIERGLATMKKYLQNSD